MSSCPRAAGSAPSQVLPHNNTSSRESRAPPHTGLAQKRSTSVTVISACAIHGAVAGVLLCCEHRRRLQASHDQLTRTRHREARPGGGTIRESPSWVAPPPPPPPRLFARPLLQASMMSAWATTPTTLLRRPRPDGHSKPLMRMRPDVGSRCPSSSEQSVDLPQPLPPMMAVTCRVHRRAGWPSGTARSRRRAGRAARRGVPHGAKTVTGTEEGRSTGHRGRPPVRGQRARSVATREAGRGVGWPAWPAWRRCRP